MTDGMNPGFVEAYNANGAVQLIPDHYLEDPILGEGFTLVDQSEMTAETAPPTPPAKTPKPTPPPAATAPGNPPA